MARGEPRVIDDLESFDSGRADNTPHIAREGYRSSYTMPMQMDGRFAGLLFFDAVEPVELGRHSRLDSNPSHRRALVRRRVRQLQNEAALLGEELVRRLCREYRLLHECPPFSLSPAAATAAARGSTSTTATPAATPAAGRAR